MIIVMNNSATDEEISFVVSRIKEKGLDASISKGTEKTVIGAYDCWGLKKFMGREYEGIHRKTFAIQNNKILKIFEKVKTTDHYQQILDALHSA